MPSSPSTIEGGICSRSDLPPDTCWHCRGHEHLQVADLDEAVSSRVTSQPTSPAIMAKRATMCRACRYTIEPGEWIIGGDEGWVHDTCAPGAP